MEILGRNLSDSEPPPHFSQTKPVHLQGASEEPAVGISKT